MNNSVLFLLISCHTSGLEYSSFINWKNYRGWAGGCSSKAEESSTQLCKEPSKSQPCKKHPSTLSALPTTGIARTTIFYSFRISVHLALCLHFFLLLFLTFFFFFSRRSCKLKKNLKCLDVASIFVWHHLFYYIFKNKR